MRLAQIGERGLALARRANGLGGDRLADDGVDDAGVAQFAFDLVRFLGRNREKVARLVLAEEERDRVNRGAGDTDFDADVPGQRHFGQR